MSGIDFETIDIEGFLSFAEPTTLPLADMQGLLLITGENRDSEGASSNGSGKSALFGGEAIVWALFGKTVRGIGYDDVVSSYANNGCRTTLVFRVGNERYEVVRTRGHSTLGNSLLLNRIVPNGSETLTGANMADTQKEIERLLGFDYNSLTSTVVFGQGAKSFVDYRDADRKALFTSFLGYDLIDNLLAETKQRIKDVNTFIADHEVKLGANKEVLEDLRNKDFDTDIERFEADREREIEDIKTHFETVEERARKKREQLHQSITDAEKELGPLRDDKTKTEQKISQLQDVAKNFDEAKAIEEEVVKQQASIRAKTSVLVKEADEIGELGDRCPTCRQTVDKSILSARVQEIADEVESLGEEKANQDDLIESARKVLTNARNARDEIHSLEIKLSGVNNKIGNLNRDITSYNNELDAVDTNAESEQGAYEATIKRIESRENPHIKLREENEKQIAVYESRVEQAESSIGKKRKELSLLIDWEVAYGNQGIRSHLFDRVLVLLDNKIHDYMMALSNGAVSVEIDTEIKTKGGETRDKFAVLVSDEYGTRPYESYSGGEKQRIRLAIDLALSDLVCEERERTFDFAIFDEVLSNLDDDGRMRMVDLWRKQIDNEQKRLILVVDHSIDIQTMFDNEITVVKENGCSVIE